MLTDEALKELLRNPMPSRHQLLEALPAIEALTARLAEVEAERDQLKKAADFHRKRADRGWFLYERTVNEFIDYKDSRPASDEDWDELRAEVSQCVAELYRLHAALAPPPSPRGDQEPR